MNRRDLLKRLVTLIAISPLAPINEKSFLPLLYESGWYDCAVMILKDIDEMTTAVKQERINPPFRLLIEEDSFYKLFKV